MYTTHKISNKFISKKKYKKLNTNKTKKTKKTKKNRKRRIAIAKLFGGDNELIQQLNPETNLQTNQETEKAKFDNIDETHKIHTTDDESLFEAYLAVLTGIVGTQYIYKLISNTVPVYAVETKYKDSPVSYPDISKIIKADTKKDNQFKKFIFYYGDKNEDGEIVPIETHYRVAVNVNKEGRGGRPTNSWEIIDPYHLYQIVGSHGFCQMFAYFISIEDTSDFVKIETANNPDEKEKIYRDNTFECLQKTLKLIKNRPDDELIKPMETEFKILKKDKKMGIGKKMTFQEFLDQLQEFTVEDTNDYIKYWLKHK